MWNYREISVGDISVSPTLITTGNHHDSVKVHEYFLFYSIVLSRLPSGWFHKLIRICFQTSWLFLYMFSWIINTFSWSSKNWVTTFPLTLNYVSYSWENISCPGVLKKSQKVLNPATESSTHPYRYPCMRPGVHLLSLISAKYLDYPSPLRLSVPL